MEYLKKKCHERIVKRGLLISPLQIWRKKNGRERKKRERGRGNQIHWIDSTSHWLSYDIKDHGFDIWLVFSLCLLYTTPPLFPFYSLSLFTSFSAFYLYTTFPPSYPLILSTLLFLPTSKPPYFPIFTPTTTKNNSSSSLFGLNIT